MKSESSAALVAVKALDNAANRLDEWMHAAGIMAFDKDHSAAVLRADMREYAGFLERKYAK